MHWSTKHGNKLVNKTKNNNNSRFGSQVRKVSSPRHKTTKIPPNRTNETLSNHPRIPTYVCLMLLANSPRKNRVKTSKISQESLKVKEDEMANILRLDNDSIIVNNPVTSELHCNKHCLTNQWSKVNTTNIELINFSKEKGFVRTPIKSLRLKKASRHPPDAESYFNPDQMALVYLPLRGSSDNHNLKLVMLKKQKDQEFFFQNALSLAPPRTLKKWQCPNCKPCGCYKNFLSGISARSETESGILEGSLYLLEGEGFLPHFGADFLFDEERLLLLPTNEEESLRQMLRLEIRLKKLDGQKKYHGVLSNFNKKMLKLTGSDLCIFGNDPRLNGYQQHFIRFSFVGSSNSSSTPTRPISDLSYCPAPDEEMLIAATDENGKTNLIDSSANNEANVEEMAKFDKTLLGQNKKSRTGTVSFNSCLLTQAKVYADILRTFRGWQSLKIIFLADIIAFFWCISTSYRVASLQRFWFRKKGLGTTENNDMIEFASMSALFGSSSSPQNCEYALRGSVGGKIKNVPGCKSEIAVFLIHNLAYVDNLVFGQDSSPLFKEGLSLYQIYHDVASCLERGSLFLQDLTLPYFGLLDQEKLSPEYIKDKCDAVEKYFEKLSSKDNRTRLFAGFPEAVIEIANLESKISVLEFSDSYVNTKKYLEESNKLGHAFSKWENSPYHQIKFSNDHGFPESIEPIRQYAKSNSKTSPIVNNLSVDPEGLINSDETTAIPPVVLFKKKLSKAEKAKAKPNEPTTFKPPKAKPPPESMDLQLPKHLAKAAPDGYSTKHARHLNERIRHLEAELAEKDRLVQHSFDWDQKFLSKKYNAVSDCYSYKTALSFSSTKRGVTENKLASFTEISQHLMNKDITKRQFLSYLAKLSFSNDGLNSGFVLQLRQSYRNYLIEYGDATWSSVVPKNYLKEFLKGVEQIYKLCFFSFPRSFAPLWFQKDTDVCQIICFSDASDSSATYSIYLRHEFYKPNDPEKHVYTYMAKSGAKIIPLNYISVPDLETLSFMEGAENTRNFMDHIQPYYPNLIGPIFACDSLNLCQKLLPSSAIFKPATGARLQKIKELVSPQSIFDAVCWVRGGSNRALQNNLADAAGKSFYSIHNLICFDQLFGSFLNDDPKNWPLKYLKDIKPISVRHFQDLLSKYQGIVSKLDQSFIEQAPSEKEIKNDLVNFLHYLPKKPSILKTKPRVENPPKPTKCPEHCVLFTQVSPESDTSDCEFDVCSHGLPEPWVLNIQEEEKPTNSSRNVKFLPTTSWQTFHHTEPVINIERFLPESNKITELDLQRNSKSSILDHVKPQVDMRQFMLRQIVLNEGNEPQLAVNLIKLNPKIKVDKQLKHVEKLSKVKKGHKVSSNKLKVLPDGSVSKFHRSEFCPVKQPFDDLIDSKWNLFSTLNILGNCLRIRPEYKSTPRLILNSKVEHQLLKLCENNTKNYLAQSNHSDVDIVYAGGVFLQKLRGFKSSPDMTYRIVLPAALSLSKGLARFVHLLSCGYSAKRQTVILESLGYYVPYISKYFETLTNLECHECLRRQASQQQLSLGALPKVLAQYQTPFQIGSCDISYGWHYRQNKYKQRVFRHHFCCVHSRALFTICQTEISAESFVKSLLSLAACYGNVPSLLYLDLGSDYVSVQRRILETEEEEEDIDLAETRSATKSKKKQPTKLRKYIEALNDVDKEKMVKKCAKFGTVLMFHASNDSHLTFAEPYIAKFNKVRKLAGFDKLKLNFEDYSLSARLTDNVINSSPLLYMRNKEEIHQICPMNLLLGRLTIHNPILSSVAPFNTSSITELIDLAYFIQQAYFQFYQERLQKILEFYDKKASSLPEVLGREMLPGDLALYKSRSKNMLKLAVIVQVRDKSIEGYTEATKYTIKFCPQTPAKLRSDDVKTLLEPWPTQLKSVGAKSLCPILSKDQLYLDLESLIDDLGLTEQQIDKINHDVEVLNSKKEGFHSKLFQHQLSPALLSRALFNEALPDQSPDEFYRKSRPLKFGLKGLVGARPTPKASDVEILKNLVLPTKFVPEDEYWNGDKETKNPNTSMEPSVLSKDQPIRSKVDQSSIDAQLPIQIIPNEILDLDDDDLDEIPDLSVVNKPLTVSMKNEPEDLDHINDLPKFIKKAKGKSRRKK